MYAQHGRELMGRKRLCVNLVANKVAEVLAEGKRGNWHDQRLAHGPPHALDPATVDQPSLPVVTIDGHTVMNRPVRTRMPEGVGRAG